MLSLYLWYFDLKSLSYGTKLLSNVDIAFFTHCLLFTSHLNKTKQPEAETIKCNWSPDTKNM